MLEFVSVLVAVYCHLQLLDISYLILSYLVVFSSLAGQKYNIMSLALHDKHLHTYAFAKTYATITARAS